MVQSDMNNFGVRPEVQNQRDLACLLNKREFSDVTLMVEGKPIYAHQVILASRSTYFEALFTHDFAEKDLRVVDFNDSGITYDQLFQLLKHIYSDNMKIDSKFIYDLLSVSSMFLIIYYFCSLLTDMTSNRSKESASTSSLNTSAWTLYAKYSNMPTTSIAKDSKKLAFYSPRRTTKKSSHLAVLRNWTKKKCFRSSE